MFLLDTISLDLILMFFSIVLRSDFEIKLINFQYFATNFVKLFLTSCQISSD